MRRQTSGTALDCEILPGARRWIGDIHGDPWFPVYAKLIDTPLPTCQIGDLGCGFGQIPPMARKDRWIRGNHDDPVSSRTHANWIPDGTVEGDTLYVGGASSHDRHTRIPGETWWPDEELDIPAWTEVIDRHAAARPRIVASHDLPESARAILFPQTIEEAPSRTRQALQVMLEMHAPQVWIFGHWHDGRDEVVHGVRFIGLGLHEARDLIL